MCRHASLTITEGHRQTISTPTVHNNCHEKLSSQPSKPLFANNDLYDNNISIAYNAYTLAWCIHSTTFHREVHIDHQNFIPYFIAGNKMLGMFLSTKLIFSASGCTLFLTKWTCYKPPTFQHMAFLYASEREIKQR